MKTIRVKRGFTDMESFDEPTDVFVDQTYQVSDERAEFLANHEKGLAEIVEDISMPTSQDLDLTPPLKTEEGLVGTKETGLKQDKDENTGDEESTPRRTRRAARRSR